MSLEEKIKAVIGRLDAKWFADVKAEFESNPFYNKELKAIDDAIEENDIFFDGEDTIVNEVRTISIQSTLPEYSWKGLPISFTNINPDDGEEIYKACSLTTEIIQVIDELINEMTDVSNKHQLVVSAIKYILEEANTLKSEVKDSEYDDSIDHCVSQFRYELSKKYGVIKRAHDTIVEFEDKLVFDLNQKELAFLLAVLIRAGFLEDAKKKGVTLYHFFSKYFYFKNQREGNSFTRATTINKKISEAMSSGNSSGDYRNVKEDIKQRLMDAINDL